MVVNGQLKVVVMALFVPHTEEVAKSCVLERL
jgi:hypothetical protein